MPQQCSHVAVWCWLWTSKCNLGWYLVSIKRRKTIAVQKGENIAMAGRKQKDVGRMKSVGWENCI